MAEKKEISFQNRVEDRLTLFLRKNRNVLIISSAAIVLALVILIIVLSVGSSRTEANQQRIDELSVQYDEWVAAEEGIALPENLVADLSEVADTKKSAYPALKAEYLLALISADQDQWSDAKAHLETIVSNGSETYLGSLALFNLGIVSEESGDAAAALEYYQEVYDSTGGNAAESARALLSVARLHEANGDNELASAVLQQLADEYPESEYAKLALSHLVLLKK